MRTWIALSVALAAGATFFNSVRPRCSPLKGPLRPPRCGDGHASSLPPRARPQLDGEFVVDDQHTVEKNQVVRGNLTDVAAFFAHDYWVSLAPVPRRPRGAYPGVLAQGGPIAHPESHKVGGAVACSPNAAALTPPHGAQSFRPLASLSLALDHALCGLRPRCYHASGCRACFLPHCPRKRPLTSPWVQPTSPCTASPPPWQRSPRHAS